jgi:hypothetical protein
LHACRAASSGPEPFFDRITRLAAHSFACPIVVVSLVGQDSVCFKSHAPCWARKLGLGIMVVGK